MTSKCHTAKTKPWVIHDL